MKKWEKEILAKQTGNEAMTVVNLEKVYKRLEKIRNTKPISNTKSFFAYKLNKKEKSLHNKTILSKFAALFSKIIKKY